MFISSPADLRHVADDDRDLRRVEFRSPAFLIERLDAIADLLERDRTDLLAEAVHEYVEDTAESEPFQDLVATKYYDDQLEFETVERLVGAETAQRLQLLKADLEGQSLDLGAPEEVDVYEGDDLSIAPKDFCDADE